jgi:hypothetical protein
LISSIGRESEIVDSSVTCKRNEQLRVFIVEIRCVEIFELVGGRSHRD